MAEVRSDAHSLPAEGVVAVSPDELLVGQVKEGNLEAFNQLVRKYRERIFSVVYNMTSNREDANDLTQEAFIKAFHSIDRFRGQAHFFTWMYRIAVNTTLSALRRNRTRRFFSFENLADEVPQAEVLEFTASALQTEKPVLMKELQEKLNEALQSLSPKHRIVVVLFEIEGLSHEEISRVLRCSEGTVRSRLHYAKQHLQRLLKPYLRNP